MTQQRSRMLLALLLLVVMCIVNAYYTQPVLQAGNSLSKASIHLHRYYEQHSSTLDHKLSTATLLRRQHLRATASDNDDNNSNNTRDKSKRRKMKKASSASINVDFEADPADPSQSLEERLGLRSDQLRELLEQELPVPREDLIARKDKTAEQPKEVDDPNKVFRLPDLVDFNKEAKDDNKQTARQQAIIDANKPRVDRGDSEEFMRLLQLNPFADADESLFLEEYDIFPSIFGQGKLLNIPIPYLQTGHAILAFILLLGAFVYNPNNPLTALPDELRDCLKQSILFVYSINLVIAIQAYFIAKKKHLPPVFWLVKTFIFGGIALHEVGETKDPLSLQKTKNNQERRSKRKQL